jgi:peroxiredoxin
MKTVSSTFRIALASGALVLGLAAAAPALEVGQKAPDFTLAAPGGKTVKLSDLLGKGPVVLYFFPRAFTPTCTIETRGFRDAYTELRDLGAQVLGISTDTLETQCSFAAKNTVSFPMIGDSTSRISRAYKALWPILPLAQRVTYVLDEEGIIVARFHHEFHGKKHIDDVLSFLRRWRAGRGARAAE